MDPRLIDWITSRFRLAILGLIVLSAFVRIFVSWQPVDTLIEKNLPDDAFYYFTIAHNVTHGYGASVDKVNQTNGFHPLWLILILPIFRMFDVRGDLPIHLALTLASLIDLFTILMIIRIVELLSGERKLGIAAGIVYAFNPFVIFQITNGLETSIANASLAAFTLLVIVSVKARSQLRYAALVGIAGGLMILARTDSIFYFLLAVSVSSWRKDVMFSLQYLTIIGLSAAVVIFPWLVWSRISTGDWIQNSGVAVPFAIHTRFVMEHGSGFSAKLAEGIRQIMHPATLLRGDYSGMPFIIGNLIWLLVVLGTLFWSRGRLDNTSARILIPLIASNFLVVIFHSGLRWYPRPWYFVPAAITFVICLALGLRRWMGSPKILFTSAVFFLCYFMMSGYIAWQIGYYPWQRDMLTTKNWLDTHIADDAIVASFNSGIYSYYSKFQVINLDGVVNTAAFNAVMEQEIFGYLQENAVDFLVDSDHAILREYGPFMGPGFPEQLDELVELDTEFSAAFGSIRVYRIDSD